MERRRQMGVVVSFRYPIAPQLAVDRLDRNRKAAYLGEGLAAGSADPTDGAVRRVQASQMCMIA
jgi:hypothetical protein